MLFHTSIAWHIWFWFVKRHIFTSIAWLTHFILYKKIYKCLNTLLEIKSTLYSVFFTSIAWQNIWFQILDLSKDIQMFFATHKLAETMFFVVWINLVNQIKCMSSSDWIKGKDMNLLLGNLHLLNLPPKSIPEYRNHSRTAYIDINRDSFAGYTGPLSVPVLFRGSGKWR